MKVLLSLFAVGLLSVSNVHGAKLQGHTFDDKMTLDGKELVLNGLGLRTVTRFGINIKVYVMGLYVPKKSTSGEELLKDLEGPKVFKMSFHRNVDSESIEDAWTESFKENCGTVCEAAKPQLKEFNSAMSDMRTKQTITMVIYKDKVDVDAQGRKKMKKTVQGADFARVLERMFIGPKPVQQTLKSGLLGGK